MSQASSIEQSLHACMIHREQTPRSFSLGKREIYSDPLSAAGFSGA
jgi:hypothetical protein